MVQGQEDSPLTSPDLSTSLHKKSVAAAAVVVVVQLSVIIH